MKSNKVLFEVQREPGMYFFLYSIIICILDEDDIMDEVDPTAGRFVQYRFPPTFLKLKQVGAL
jgi:hypothetical protein